MTIKEHVKDYFYGLIGLIILLGIPAGILILLGAWILVKWTLIISGIMLIAVLIIMGIGYLLGPLLQFFL